MGSELCSLRLNLSFVPKTWIVTLPFPCCCNPSKSSSLILVSPFACAQALHSTQTFKIRPRVLPTSKYDTDGKLYLMNPKRNASMLKFDWAEGVYFITSKLSIAGDWSVDLKVTNEMYYPLYKYVVS
ncbi:hypothetical protein DSO57_1006322 [Entomophthora muscae]|uniref:Uncharacterized protein n=2 Tax=Entomophthora muscae TaxID=34485 RepID=A0ACC2T7K8_9FUNG|nr:hypothetical protein DSO57_1006322 [Entomophthora muscae]